MYRTTARASLDTFSILITAFAPPPLIQGKAHSAKDKPIRRTAARKDMASNRPELERLLLNSFIR